MYEAEARERQRLAGAKNLENFNNGLVTPGLEQLGKAPAPRAKTSVEQAADAFGISKHVVADIKSIAKNAPEKLKAMESGKLTLQEAKKEIADVKRIEK
jgi:hypothetical protein